MWLLFFLKAFGYDPPPCAKPSGQGVFAGKSFANRRINLKQIAEEMPEAQLPGCRGTRHVRIAGEYFADQVKASQRTRLNAKAPSTQQFVLLTNVQIIEPQIKMQQQILPFAKALRHRSKRKGSISGRLQHAFAKRQKRAGHNSKTRPLPVPIGSDQILGLQQGQRIRKSTPGASWEPYSTPSTPPAEISRRSLGP